MARLGFISPRRHEEHEVFWGLLGFFTTKHTEHTKRRALIFMKFHVFHGSGLFNAETQRRRGVARASCPCSMGGTPMPQGFWGGCSNCRSRVERRRSTSLVATTQWPATVRMKAVLCLFEYSVYSSINVRVILRDLPARATVSSTLSPGWRGSSMACTSSIVVTACPSTATMMSPKTNSPKRLSPTPARPACAAGSAQTPRRPNTSQARACVT